MTKTRMNKGDREKIVSAIIDRKYEPLMQEHSALQQGLFDRLYSHFYSPSARRLMTQLSSEMGGGCFGTRRDLCIRVQGENFTVGSLGSVLVVEKHEYGVLRDFGPGACPMADEVQAWCVRGKELIEERSKERRELMLLLSGFMTFDALHEAWPEASAFVSPVWRAKEQGSTALAVSFRDACVKFKLPPTEEEQRALENKAVA